MQKVEFSPWHIHFFQSRNLATLIALMALLLVIACASRNLPEESPAKIDSRALEPASEGKLADLAAEIAANHGKDTSAVLPMDRNDEALRWRLMLADLAQKSIDLQTFIWHDDATGSLLFARLIAAADRGVRVRLLVDDLLITTDEGIAALDYHPNIQIRIFNPWHGRETTVGKGLEFITKMDRLNQRMHNKLMVADNHLTIVGGRNIGNEYFGISSKFNFRDMDVITVGPIAQEVSRTFDIYWNHDWAYPGGVFSEEKATSDQLEQIKKVIQKEIEKSNELLEQFTLEPQKWEDYLFRLSRESSTGRMWVVYDDPPVSVAGGTQVRKIERLDKLDDEAENEMLIVSAYFIPDEEDIEYIRRLTRKGVTVRILTNSLGSNDEIITNSAYKYKRIPVLETGAELYETRYDAKDRMLSEDPRVNAQWLGMHSKFIVVDRKSSYVGSLNLDPRSLKINTEMGLVIEDAVLGEQLAQIAERDMSPENAWQVNLDEQGKLYWEAGDARVTSQPARTFWRRIGDGFFSLLPIKNQL